MERAFYRVKEAAEVIGLSRAMTYRLVKLGKIPSVRIEGADPARSREGGCVRIRRIDLLAWIEAQGLQESRS